MDGYEFMRLAQAVEPRDLAYERGWFWVTASILTWSAFWYFADAHGQSPSAQYIAWAAVGLSVWFARNF